MSEIISTISDICGILAFFISLFAVSQIFKLKQKINGNDNNQVSIKGNIKGGFVGRDKK
ncbi:hypothetical protein [Empedobacter brevis]|uniref:hypothetical protein n=1 Tax=Empedobacter brevis TaxID=247 RepID=UPI0013300908|nr:hypothetical protein [Empedobacter brevis]